METIRINGVAQSIKHRCSAPGTEQGIELRQMPLNPWFMLMEEATVLVNYCPWCGQKLPMDYGRPNAAPKR